MQRPSKQLWQIVPRPIQTKVAKGWLDREGTIAYLSRLYEATWRLPAGEIQSAGAPRPAGFLTAQFVDLARVYAVAAQCVQFDTYKDFKTAMNQIPVWQLAGELVGNPPWPASDLYRAHKLILLPTSNRL